MKRIENAVSKIRKMVRRRCEEAQNEISNKERIEAEYKLKRKEFWDEEKKLAFEKIRKGKQILDFLNTVKKNNMFKEGVSLSLHPLTPNLRLHSRKLTNPLEYQESIPREDREVTEYFILNRKMDMIYYQNYEAKHYGEGLMMNFRSKNPLDHGGFTVRKKRDFTKLSYASVNCLHMAIASRAIYGSIAENMLNNWRVNYLPTSSEASCFTG